MNKFAFSFQGVLNRWLPLNTLSIISCLLSGPKIPMPFGRFCWKGRYPLTMIFWFVRSN